MRPDGERYDEGRDHARAEVLSVASHRTGGRVVVQLDGELDMAGADAVAAEVRRHLGADVEVIEIDGVGLAFVDSAGLRALLGLQTEVQSAGVRFGVVASEHLTRLLRLTGLSDVLTLVA